MKRVLVTGANGFIGRHLVEYLRTCDYEVIETDRSQCNLLDRKETNLLFRVTKPDIVVHCAGYNGGIGFNGLYAADIFYQNSLMALNVLDAVRRQWVGKLISLVTSCSYPDSDQELVEDEYWSGAPNPSVACHGFAKRNLVAGSRMFNQQYGINAVTLCPNTVYGPRDRTDPMRSKVMMGMIKGICCAHALNMPSVEMRGTGKPYREFIYVKDLVRIIQIAMEHYNDSQLPLNINFPNEIQLKDLAAMIARIVGYDGMLRWDTSLPDGQMRKTLNGRRMMKLLEELKIDFKPTSLEDGIEETVRWYKKQLKEDE